MLEKVLFFPMFRKRSSDVRCQIERFFIELLMLLSYKCLCMLKSQVTCTSNKQKKYEDLFIGYHRGNHSSYLSSVANFILIEGHHVSILII